jgi:flagellar protein FliT
MEQAALVERVVALTGEIEHAAALDNWVEAARLTEVRSPLLMSLSARQPPAALEAIRSLMTRNAALLANAQSSQAELQAEFSHAMGRTKAVSLYHRTALL